MAKIITIANRKGGVGKTTIATNLVVALQLKGKTLLVDSDEQQSSIKWNEGREEKIDSKAIFKNLADELEVLDSDYEYILIDISGKDSEVFREALLISDTLIVPIQHSIFDLEVMPYLEEKVKQAMQVNTELKSFVLINRASTNVKSIEVEQAKDFLADYPTFKMVNTVIKDRKQFRDAVISSKSVTEMNSSKARDEINDLIIEVM